MALAGLNAVALRAVPQREWEDIVAFANAAGSLATAQKGAIPALPTHAAIEACMADTPALATR